MASKDRILIVDDNPDSVWPLIEHLEPDYEVLFATTAEKALTLAFSANRPDLILLDVMMPDMDGYQLLSRFKAEIYTRDIPVVFITARSEHLDEVKGLEIGAQDYIVKPFSLTVVSARIKSVLSLKKELDRRLILKTQLEEMNQQLERQVRNKMVELNEAREALRAYEDKYNYLFKSVPSAPRSSKVLVVDDNPDNIHVLVAALEDGYQVLYATSGDKALTIANSENRPDAILLDVSMPGMDGYEVCSRLKASSETWDIPVIFISARDQEVDETRGLNLGAVDFIIKPFSLPVVKARLKAALRLKEEMDNRIVLTHKLEDLNKNLEKRVQEKTQALKQAHEDLLASEKRYRTIYETAIEGIFEVTARGRLLSASPSLARILGYESALELISTVNDVARQLYVTPEDRIQFVAKLEQEGELFNFETRFRRKQGDIIWVMICAKVVHKEIGGQTYYQGFLIDITPQKRSQLKNEQHLRELGLLNKIIAASVTETQIEGILEIACRELSHAFNLTQAVAVLLDKDQTRAKVAAEHIPIENKSIAAGRSLLNQAIELADHPLAAQMVEAPSGMVIQDVREDERLGPIADTLTDRDVRSLLLVPFMAGGQPAGCLAMGSMESNYFSEDKIRLVQSVADQISGVLARIQLDEDRRQLERQYFQAQKMEAIGQLTGGVAHDFNNILTVILGLSDMLRQAEDPQGRKRARLDQIHGAAGRAADLVRQLMAFSRQQILQPVPLNFNTILRQFEKMIDRIIGEDIEMVTVFESDLGMVKVDQGQMEQVLMNLVVNARDAMPHGGCLTIETANVVLDEAYAGHHVGVQPGPYVMVAVSDTGIGIEKSLLPQVFEPFFTTKAKGEGTGLGLATVHGIVNQSGGHIWVYSEPGEGTSFKIYFPVHVEDGSEDLAGRITEVASKAIGGVETILVVEDDEALREIVFNTLSGFGYTVLTADRATAADNILATHDHTVDLLVTDVIIPGKENGVHLAKRLCAGQPGMKVLYMSGYTNNAIVHHGVLDPGVSFIQKPFLPDDLARKVRQTLDRDG